jgi:hypothetical protein
MKSKIIAICFAVMMACASVPAHAQEKVRTENGCSVFMAEAPPPNTTVRWNGPCSKQGMADGAGTLQAAGGDMLSYSESGSMAAGKKIGTWFRRYEAIGIELRWMYPKNFAPGVDVHKTSKPWAEGERQAYAFMGKVVEEGDFASPAALGVAHLIAAQNNTAIIPTPIEKPGDRTSQHSNAASTCGRSINWSATNETHVGVTTFAHTYQILATDPVTIGHAVAPGALSPGRLDEYIKDTERSLQQDNENSACHQVRHCREDKIGLEKTLTWLKCIANNSRDTRTPPTESAEELDNITPQVAGCPRYLRKSLVHWYPKAGSNSQLGIWEVRNTSNRKLQVFYDKGGSIENVGTLNSGATTEAWQINSEPRYVVRDFDEVLNFNATKPQQRSLQCNLAIRPR